MQNKAYLNTYNGYKEWIARLNYAVSTRKVNCRQLEYFLNWLEVQAIESLEQIKSADYELYLEHLRNKTKRGKAISHSTIRSYFNVINHLNQYLEQHGVAPIIKRKYVRHKKSNFQPVILSREEIELLYETCTNNEVGLRNRAILTLYYSCGLRSAEGANLTLDDVDLKNGWIHVRKGKYYLERYVPLTEKGKSELNNYLKYARWFFIKEHNEWFLLTVNGKKVGSGSLLNNMHRLRKHAEIEKKFNIHGLRHSIATHLLENGMGLERIQQFLGHRNLMATQIYTHIVERNQIVG